MAGQQQTGKTTLREMGGLIFLADNQHGILWYG